MQELKLFDDNQYIDGFDRDDYETPDGTSGSRHIAQLFRTLVTPRDVVILEPTAGRGNIIGQMPSDRTRYAIEINPERVVDGRSRYPDVIWREGNLFAYRAPSFSLAPVDVIVGNPPFSIAVEVIECCLTLLDDEADDPRIIFLLPTNFFQTQERAEKFQKLNASLCSMEQIVGRIAYLRNGVVIKGRQCDDSIFTIRPGKAMLSGIHLVNP